MNSQIDQSAQGPDLLLTKKSSKKIIFVPESIVNGSSINCWGLRINDLFLRHRSAILRVQRRTQRTVAPNLRLYLEGMRSEQRSVTVTGVSLTWGRRPRTWHAADAPFAPQIRLPRLSCQVGIRQPTTSRHRDAAQRTSVINASAYFSLNNIFPFYCGLELLRS